MRIALLATFLSCCSAAVLAQQPQPDPMQPIRLGLPIHDWVLLADLPGFKLEAYDLKPDASGRMMRASGPDGMVISIFTEHMPGYSDADSCRSYYHEMLVQNSTVKMSDSRLEDRGEWRLGWYTIEKFEGFPIHQRNVNAYLGRKDACIDVHISKTTYKDSDAALFDRLLASLRIDPAPEAQVFSTLPDAEMLTRITEGHVAYQAGDYAKAIAAYRRVGELETKRPQLSLIHYRVLMDNLATAYGVSGNGAAARETALAGIGRDPDYPMYYYMLACADAEDGNRDGALANLRHAIERRQNVIAGERVPDPAHDPSFARLKEDPEFLAITAPLR